MGLQKIIDTLIAMAITAAVFGPGLWGMGWLLSLAWRQQPNELRYPRWYLGLGVFAALASLACVLLGFFLTEPNVSNYIGVGLTAAGFGAGALAILLPGLNWKLVVEQGRLIHTDWRGRTRVVLWTQVRRLRFEKRDSAVNLDLKSGGRIYVSLTPRAGLLFAAAKAHGVRTANVPPELRDGGDLLIEEP